MAMVFRRWVAAGLRSSSSRRCPWPASARDALTGCKPNLTALHNRPAGNFNFAEPLPEAHRPFADAKFLQSFRGISSGHGDQAVERAARISGVVIRSADSVVGLHSATSNSRSHTVARMSIRSARIHQRQQILVPRPRQTASSSVSRDRCIGPVRASRTAKTRYIALCRVRF